VFATQCLQQDKSKNFRINVDGELPFGVTSKDVILGIINEIGAGGAAGHVIEYTGSTIRGLSMEGRMTVCNMSIEGGAKAGLIAPDEITFAYIKGKPFAPQNEQWDWSVDAWRALTTDAGASYDKSVNIDAASLEPFVTWGTSPDMSVKVTDTVARSYQRPRRK